MSIQKTTNARTLAAFVLHQFDPKKGYASDILNKHILKLKTPTEKQRATDLVFGTLRNLSVIDHCIEKLADCPTKQIQTKILNIIRPAVYELLQCPYTPDYSIVNEAVETTKSTAAKKQTAFVNAVLRQIKRHITNRNADLKNTNPQKTIPQNIFKGCLFDIEILPDSQTYPLDYLSLAFSLPAFLVQSWLDEYGYESTYKICLASNRRPHIWIRPNTLKTSTKQLAEKLLKNNIQSQPSSDNTMIQIKSPAAITNLPGFKAGEFTIQDLTASKTVRQLNPQPGQRILDLCAAPGTKTTQMAEQTYDKAEIIATDISPQRLKMVQENKKRLGIKSVKTISYEKIEEEYHEKGAFDCILLDVPCSNTAVLCKRIEARFRITPTVIKKISKTQLKLLDLAAKLVTTNGKTCYSTCSIQPEENSLLIKKFLEKNKSFEIEMEKLTLPSAESPDHDGGYVAIITKKQSSPLAQSESTP